MCPCADVCSAGGGGRGSERERKTMEGATLASNSDARQAWEFWAAHPTFRRATPRTVWRCSCSSLFDRPRDCDPIGFDLRRCLSLFKSDRLQTLLASIVFASANH